MPRTHSSGRTRVWRSSILVPGLALAALLSLAPSVEAGFIGPYALNNFSLTNTNADGSVATPDAGLTAVLTGGNNGSGNPGSTDLLIQAAAAGLVKFDYSYSACNPSFPLSCDDPTFDSAGYLKGGVFTQLANSNGQSGVGIQFTVTAGQLFGFRVATADNFGEAGILTIANFSAPTGSAAVPEPGTISLLMPVAGLLFWFKRRRMLPAAAAVLAITVAISSPALAQQNTYVGSTATGKLVLTRTVNVMQVAQSSVGGLGIQVQAGPEVPKALPNHTRPPRRASSGGFSISAASTGSSLTISPSTTAFGFDGITHAQQRNANAGNQYSVEPPNPGIGVGNGFVAVGVNSAFQVYNSTTGAPLLPAVITSNQLFGLAPSIIWGTGVNGPFLVDMRVFYDAGVNRFFVLQQGQDVDVFGTPQPTSHLYLAVSQSGDPTGVFNIYVMNTTNNHPGLYFSCPCVSDYPQIGADQYGFYISTNEMNAYSGYFADASILAISKLGLAAGATAPTAAQFFIPFFNGYEFAIQPATTPPGASYLLANGGGEYFVSTQATYDDNNLAVWLMTNTSTLSGSSPSMTLTQILTASVPYAFPNFIANQKPGPTPYLDSQTGTHGSPELIDGNDNRVLAVSYSNARLFVTLATQVRDEDGRILVGGAYAVLTPSYRAGTLAAPTLRYGYLMARTNHLLRPAIAVNAQGRGAITMTLVGTSYYPSAAFVPIDILTTGTTLQIAGTGSAPEDGFSGYPSNIARWGDYAAATAASDGRIWMATEYIPNLARTPLANWGIYIARYIP